MRINILCLVITILFMNSTTLFSQNDSTKTDSVSMVKHRQLTIIESNWALSRKFSENNMTYKCGLFNANLINYTKDCPKSNLEFRKGAKLQKLSVFSMLTAATCISFIGIQKPFSDNVNKLLFYGSAITGFTFTTRIYINGVLHQKKGIELYNLGY